MGVACAGLAAGSGVHSKNWSLALRSADGVFDKPSFRQAVRRRRCLLPASGFYEWQATPGGKQPWYITRRDGAFHEFRSRRERPDEPRPKVSILIRTVNRTAWLREALASCANQTWDNLEVVIVEDGAPASKAVVDSFREPTTMRLSPPRDARSPIDSVLTTSSAGAATKAGPAVGSGR